MRFNSENIFEHHLYAKHSAESLRCIMTTTWFIPFRNAVAENHELVVNITT